MPIKPLTGVLLAAPALLLLAPSTAAQGPDGRVLPRGVLELRVQGSYTQFRERFGPGGTEPLGAGFDLLIAEPATRLAAAAADSARVRLDAFYARTQEETGGETPLDIEPGVPRALLAGDFRDVPATLAFGLTSRITLEATGSLHRRGTIVSGLTMEGATLGRNPNPGRNNDILRRADSLYAAGAGTYLPLRNSAAGRELQRRVRQITGDTLTLPTHGVPVRALLADPSRAALDTAEAMMLRAESGRTPYYLGDLRVGTRVQLARTVDGWAAPGDSGAARGVRATIAGHVRFPTGSRAAVLFPLQFPPDGGHWGVGGEAVWDWFPSRRWWISAGGQVEVLAGADARRLAFTDETPFPDTTQVRTLRREPGPRYGASFTPRYRLTQDLALAAHYAFRHVGEVTLSGGGEDALLLGPIETTEALTAHAVGLGMSYSTVGAYRRGTSPFPAEASLLYRNVVAGSGYAPRAGSVELSARIYAPVAWRPRAAPAPPPAPEPPGEPEPVPEEPREDPPSR